MQEELEDAHTYCTAENILYIMVALYTFKAQNDNELSFCKGERLEIIDWPLSDPDCHKARNTSGQISLVPKNYLVELSQDLTRTNHAVRLWQNLRDTSTVQNLPVPSISECVYVYVTILC